MTKSESKPASKADTHAKAPQVPAASPPPAEAEAKSEPTARATPAPDDGAPSADITERLARGVEAARLLESASERVRRARRRAKRGKKGDARRSARTQLKKLRRRLQELQETVLSKGIDAEEHHTLAALLHALDLALDDFRRGKPKRKALRRIGRAAKTTRKSL